MKQTHLLFQIMILSIMVAGCNQNIITSRNQNRNNDVQNSDITATFDIEATSNFATPSIEIYKSTQNVPENVEFDQAIGDFMSNNIVECSLPCCLDFTPGVTTVESMLEYFGKNNIPLNEFPYDDGEMNFLVYLPQTKIYDNFVKFGFITNGNELDSIFVQGEKIADIEEAQNLWKNFLPKKVFEKYGIPTRILLRAPGVSGIGDTGYTGYHLWIMYDNLGFSIRYEGKVEDIPIYHICPEVNGNLVNRISIYMKSPSNSQSLDSYDGILSNEYWNGTVLSIEEATELSIEEFYELFITSEQPICFDSPHNVWPKR